MNNSLNENKEILRKHQLCLLSMLKEIDKVCKKNNIKYMLFAGSTLGAVRHEGFIPWDDDLDIIMLRPDYERFLEVAEKELDSKEFFVQKEFSEHWPMHFSKIRKNNTAFIEKYYSNDKKRHQGVYIDIFPCDNLSDNFIVRKIQFIASKMIISKCLGDRGYLTNNILKKLAIIVCRNIPIKKLFSLVKMENKNNSKMVHSFLGASSKYSKSIYQRNWMTETTSLKFEDDVFPVSKYSHELLTVLYGDYMKIPSEDERKYKVHATLIDLEKSYEEYFDWQNAQTIDVYTKSIR